MRILRSISLVRVGQATVTWGVLFAVIHAYWAAGGEAGMGGEPADTTGAQAYIAFVALLGPAGVAITAYLLLGGLLFGALGWPQAVSSGQRPCSS